MRAPCSGPATRPLYQPQGTSGAPISNQESRPLPGVLAEVDGPGEEGIDMAVTNDMDGAGAAAFGRGSDARIQGEPLENNPYPSCDCNDRKSWSRGWLHADQFYGVDARWPHRVLPAVVGERATA